MVSGNVYFLWLKASEESSAASTPRNSEAMGRGEEARGGRGEDLEYFRVSSHQTFLFLIFDVQAEAWKRGELGEHKVKRERGCGEEASLRGRLSPAHNSRTSILF